MIVRASMSHSASEDFVFQGVFGEKFEIPFLHMQRFEDGTD